MESYNSYTTTRILLIPQQKVCSRDYSRSSGVSRETAHVVPTSAWPRLLTEVPYLSIWQCGVGDVSVHGWATWQLQPFFSAVISFLRKNICANFIY